MNEKNEKFIFVFCCHILCDLTEKTATNYKSTQVLSLSSLFHTCFLTWQVFIKSFPFSQNLAKAPLVLAPDMLFSCGDFPLFCHGGPDAKINVLNLVETQGIETVFWRRQNREWLSTLSQGSILQMAYLSHSVYYRWLKPFRGLAFQNHIE